MNKSLHKHVQVPIQMQREARRGFLACELGFKEMMRNWIFFPGHFLGALFLSRLATRWEYCSTDTTYAIEIKTWHPRDYYSTTFVDTIFSGVQCVELCTDYIPGVFEQMSKLDCKKLMSRSRMGVRFIIRTWCARLLAPVLGNVAKNATKPIPKLRYLIGIIISSCQNVSLYFSYLCHAG